MVEGTLRLTKEKTEDYASQQENERQYKLVDQSLSMHSSLRDENQQCAFWLNTTQIGISLFLCVFVFVGDNVLSSLGYDPAMARFILGFSAVIVLLLSITEFRVDWRSIGSRHAQAVEHLARLKAKYRKAFSESHGNDSKKNSMLTTQYEKTIINLPPIPERHFNRLKAQHQFKGILSRRLSQNPKAPEWFLRIQLRLEGVCTALKRGEENKC